jgi:hypothetical protein
MRLCVRCGGTERYKDGTCKGCKAAAHARFKAKDPEGFRVKAAEVNRRHYRRSYTTEKARRKHATPAARYRHLVAVDAKKGRSIMSFDDYLLFEGRACIYCGDHRPITGVGLDRLNNAVGHVLENVVPCCTACNIVRGDRFTVEEMRLVLGPAIKLIREKRSQLQERGA